MTIAFLRTAQASGEGWGGTVKALLTALGPLPDDANCGLLFATTALAEDFGSILTFLRETTPIKAWTGAIAGGVIGPLGAVRERPAVAALVASLPGDSFRLLDSWREPERGSFLARHRSWLRQPAMPVGLVHGDGGGDLFAELSDLSETTASYLLGAVAQTRAPGLSGVLLGAPLRLLTGLTQGCAPLGPALQVTGAKDGIVMALDGRPALDVLKERAGPEISRDLRRAAGIIHVGLPVAGADRADYLVRPLRAIDPTRGWLAVAGPVSTGDRLLLVKRDGDSARQDMRRMLADLAQRADGRTIRGGVYYSCVARGAPMFGSDQVEASMITECLGDFPLVGMFGQGEFCHDRLYSYTGVLALLLS